MPEVRPIRAKEEVKTMPVSASISLCFKGPITFTFHFDKFLSAMGYLAEHVTDLTKFRCCKLLFFADKYHLLKYRRPVIGDAYVKMQHGPVPSEAYNWMNELMCPSEIEEIGGKASKELRRMSQVLNVENKSSHPAFSSKVHPDLSVLSESDIEALDFAIKQFGKLSVTRLWNLAHEDRAWKNAPSHWIDYRLFFDENDEDQRATLESLEEECENDQLLTRLA